MEDNVPVVFSDSSYTRTTGSIILYQFSWSYKEDTAALLMVSSSPQHPVLLLDFRRVIKGWHKYSTSEFVTLATKTFLSPGVLVLHSRQCL